MIRHLFFVFSVLLGFLVLMGMMIKEEGLGLAVRVALFVFTPAMVIAAGLYILLGAFLQAE